MEYTKIINTESNLWQKMEENWRSKKNEDTERIRKLCTAYPYGINDKVDDETIANKDTLIAWWFSPLNLKYSRACENERVKTIAISFLEKTNTHLKSDSHLPKKFVLLDWLKAL